MAFVLDKIQDMKAIYEAAKKVYNRDIVVGDAVKDLVQRIDARESSLQMYLNIYACMRKGKTYKMGTSESFTQFLLEQILREEGADAFELALKAVKGNSIYRESKNNAQPGLRRACINAISKSGLNIDYDSISVDVRGEATEHSISENDLIRLKKCIELPNADFAKTIMEMLEKYQVLTVEEISSLTDQVFCSSTFRSSYPLLKEISSDATVEEQIRDASGRNRYYSATYTLLGGIFVFTSQLYGQGSSPATRDNRTSFLGWVLARFGVEQNETSWWPSLEEYTPGFAKEQWLEILNNPEIIGPVWGSVLAMFYTEPNGATCKMLSEKFNDSPYSISGKCTQLAKRIYTETACPLIKDETNQEKQSYWPILFQGRDVKDDESGTWMWRLRSELYEALSEFGIEKYLPTVSKVGTFDSWEIIDENTAVKHCERSFFDYRGSGVPRGICWFFGAEDMNLGETKIVKLIYNGKQYQGSVKNESSDGRRVRIFWSTELGGLFDAFNVPDATATFRKIVDDTYEVSIKGGEKEMTIKEKVTAIKAYIAARGFNYEGDLIENFYLSLKSKPFVILAGTSGTGKTRLVKLFAEAISAKMQLVPVRPDWSDSSDLFGHTDLSGNFHPGAIIDFIKQAEWDKSTPHFLCLDEMNLARVEYYLSDFLSIIETRDRRENGAIETDELVDASYFQSQSAREKYGRVYIPENLYIIGTVNMDETTFPFSKKVLDRANTIEFSFVNLMARVSAGGQPVTQKLDNSFLKTDYLYLQDCDDEDLIGTVCFNLEELNQILVKANLHVGYRVRDEISFYMMNNKIAALLDFDAAFDHEIMQKIIPRVQGSSSAIKKVLSELFAKCAGDYSGFAGAAAYEQMDSYLESKTCKYPNSAKKIAFMMRRYEEDGFTSYWL